MRIQSAFSATLEIIDSGTFVQAAECLQPLFLFPCFNAMQSKVLSIAFETSENLVVSAPTGSGKTVIFEIAIARLLITKHQHKALYLAPTKSLCSEKVKDWREKFQQLDAEVVELTVSF